MTEIATIDWFGRWGTSVFSENTTIFGSVVLNSISQISMLLPFYSKEYPNILSRLPSVLYLSSRQ